MKYLICILTSRNANKLVRCIESVLSQTNDLVVICNTLDFSYVEQSRKVAEKYNLEFIVTESNGTPAKGKNSVLEIFRSRSYAYYMQVDADDYLTADALIKLDKIVSENQDVDVIGLSDGFMIYNGETTSGNAFFNGTEIYKFANIRGTHGIRLIKLGKFLAKNLEYNRMLLYSEKAVNSFKFDEKFIGSEDIVASYKLYHNSNIKYILTKEHIYVYDLEDIGNFHRFLSSSNEIKKVLDELILITHEENNG